MLTPLLYCVLVYPFVTVWSPFSRFLSVHWYLLAYQFMIKTSFWVQRSFERVFLFFHVCFPLQYLYRYCNKIILRLFMTCSHYSFTLYPVTEAVCFSMLAVGGRAAGGKKGLYLCPTYRLIRVRLVTAVYFSKNLIVFVFLPSSEATSFSRVIMYQIRFTSDFLPLLDNRFTRWRFHRLIKTRKK